MIEICSQKYVQRSLQKRFFVHVIVTKRQNEVVSTITKFAINMLNWRSVVVETMFLRLQSFEQFLISTIHNTTNFINMPCISAGRYSSYTCWALRKPPRAETQTQYETLYWPFMEQKISLSLSTGIPSSRTFLLIKVLTTRS
jgi:hypothetical protein